MSTAAKHFIRMGKKSNSLSFREFLFCHCDKTSYGVNNAPRELHVPLVISNNSTIPSQDIRFNEDFTGLILVVSLMLTIGI